MMSHIGGELAEGGVRIALPDGWVEVDPSPHDDEVDGSTVQAITVADWDQAQGLRPTMTVTVTAPTSDHAAARVLDEAQANLREVHVVSIDPWRVPGHASTGRRLVFAHTDGDVTLCTLVWAMTTTSGDVIISAHAESTELHVHDRAFMDAVAGIELPDVPELAAAEAPKTAELARSTRPARWADVAPTSAGARAAMVANPDARILVEASVGATSLRFDATLAGDQATISATPSPREVNHPSAAKAAGGPDRQVEAATTSFRIPVSRLALAVSQWLGLGPAWTAAARPVTVPISLVMNRLVDPTIPPPDGVDTTTWRQPWFLWTLRSSATDSGLVMVDTGTSGQCAVMETDEDHTTRFAPLSSYKVWLTLNWLVSESLGPVG
jgi:hypothetical protein